MHLTDDLSHRAGLLIARAAAEGVGSGSRPIAVVDVKPVYEDGPLKGFTILTDADVDLWEDDGA